VTVGGEEGVRAVGARQAREGWEETVVCAAEDFEGGMGGGGGSSGHGCGGRGDVAGGEGGVEGCD